MLRHRCPWCGEPIGILWDAFSISRRFRMFNRNYDYYSQKYQERRCRHCHQKYRNIISLRSALLITIPFFVLFFTSAFLRRNFVFVIGFLIVCFFLFLLLLRQPYRRDNDGEPLPLPQKATASLTWSSLSQKGLLCPRQRVPNGEVFPAYFLDSGNNLISSAYCVCLDSISWQDSHHCSCEISLVLDGAPTELLTKGNQFYLYHEKRRIASGTIG